MKNKSLIAATTLVVAVLAGAWANSQPTALLTDSTSTISTESKVAPDVSLSAISPDSAAQRLRQFGNRMSAAFAKFSPLPGGDEAQPNVGLTSLRAAVSFAMTRPSVELDQDAKLLNSRIEDERWIERANSGALSIDEQEVLRKILDDQSALNLAIIQRKLADVERDFL